MGNDFFRQQLLQSYLLDIRYPFARQRYHTYFDPPFKEPNTPAPPYLTASFLLLSPTY
jgi:hypothetical protein